MILSRTASRSPLLKEFNRPGSAAISILRSRLGSPHLDRQPSRTAIRSIRTGAGQSCWRRDRKPLHRHFDEGRGRSGWVMLGRRPKVVLGGWPPRGPPLPYCGYATDVAEEPAGRPRTINGRAWLWAHKKLAVIGLASRQLTRVSRPAVILIGPLRRSISMPADTIVRDLFQSHPQGLAPSVLSAPKLAPTTPTRLFYRELLLVRRGPNVTTPLLPSTA